MGRKNKKARDDYWESEYLKDMEEMEEEVEQNGPATAGETEEFDIDDIGEIDVADDFIEGEGEEELLVQPDGHTDCGGECGAAKPPVDWTDSEEEAEELDYTVGELDAVVAKVRRWLQQMKEKDDLPSTGDVLMQRMAPLCKSARQLPTEVYMAVLMQIGAVVVLDLDGNPVPSGTTVDPKTSRLAFSTGMQRKCSSGLARELAEKEHPVVADCLMQVFNHLKVIQDRPETSEGVIEILKKASNVQKDIPVADVLTVFVDEGSIVLEEATARGGVKITKATYHFDKLAKSQQKGSGMSVGMILLVLILIVPAILAKFMN
eukprot:CAMPEP_0114616116 /NCGR_PEP_ID=MMETSP0168-20121206/6521_1 /TAXON_ID=95228 ORGANISM="Vannella sp., Strain DIVA3 517/6/12" /NCGR_SAMPLE_ID=MMETSP0168 /ASSEMBLY_ACC=CAM_ASM_000044 /LENGTH=318 /DNA_ID=CAMNT_0001827221 /DNA_START=61 /DNA_END=1017 /DNA_ORIENTATION=+